MYSYRIEQAIRAATILHKGQIRKGAAPIPYIAHPMAVSYIAMDYTDNEDVLIGALLHDTIEDTDYTAKEIQEDFGVTVREIVEALSEPAEKDGESATWKERKKQYAKQLKKAPEAALIIAAADKIHNMRSIVEEYFDDHTRFMNDFHGSLEDRVAVYTEISEILNDRLENGILKEFNHVFTEYTKFIDDVQKTKSAEEEF